MADFARFVGHPDACRAARQLSRVTAFGRKATETVLTDTRSHSMCKRLLKPADTIVVVMLFSLSLPAVLVQRFFATQSGGVIGKSAHPNGAYEFAGPGQWYARFLIQERSQRQEEARRALDNAEKYNTPRRIPRAMIEELRAKLDVE